MAAIYHHALKDGTTLANFRIDRVLGVGGFGITYQAHDLNLERDVAIKEYFPSSLALREDDGLSIKAKGEEQQDNYDYGLERFLDEGKTLARFNQPNIVRVTQFLELNNTGYLVMDYEEGESLYLRLKKQVTLGVQELLEIVIPILQGLSVVHEKQFLHRDIKPANIFICNDGRPVLLDFGSARQAIQDREMTAIITPGYAPFEQYYSKENQGPWTDLYAIGATMFVAATGIKPPPALDRNREVKAGKTDPVEQILRQVNIDDALAEAVLNLMQTAHDLRPQQAADAIDELQKLRQAAPSDEDIQWDDDFLQAVEQVLREKKVSNARALIDRAAQKAHSEEEMTELLAVSVEDNEDKTEFKAKAAELIQHDDDKTSYSDPTAELPLYEILRRSGIVLATIIGPEAEQWVGAAARQAETREGFYEYILDKLEPGQRDEFMYGVMKFDAGVQTLNLKNVSA